MLRIWRLIFICRVFSSFQVFHRDPPYDKCMVQMVHIDSPLHLILKLVVIMGDFIHLWHHFNQNS